MKTLELTPNALAVLRRRYLLKNDRREIIETPTQMFKRVAKSIAIAEGRHGGDVQRAEQEFFEVMQTLKFLPNSPTLMNAGTRLGQLSACFVLPVLDSTQGIFDAVKHMAEIHRSGGGTGFSFSRLRPEGDIILSTKGSASGPISFMEVFDKTTDVIKQGGRRRGANMGVLRVDHPDVLKFISAKRRPDYLTNFNISVAVTDRFMRAAREGRNYDLVNPRTGRRVATLNAKKVFAEIVKNAWRTGDPGLFFIDETNRRHPLQKLGGIESTNPCGEQPLLPYESCNLGSINLSKFVHGGKIDWQELKRVVHVAVRFLDDVIDVNKFPLAKVADVTRANRKIGLGVMGWADMLVQLGISYDSDRAIDFAKRLMRFIHGEAVEASKALARKRGVFPNWKSSTWAKKGIRLRNATLTTIAPTGTISLIAGTASGIEPFFAVAFIRNIMEGSRLLEVSPIFERIARERGFYSKELMREIAKTGSVQRNFKVPKDVRKLFVTAFDIAPEWHVRIQAAFQKHTDNAVSKTVNLKHDVSIDTVRKIYWLAYDLKCKGITVYRYGCKPKQVLTIEPLKKTYVSAESEYAGECPAPYCPF